MAQGHTRAPGADELDGGGQIVIVEAGVIWEVRLCLSQETAYARGVVKDGLIRSPNGGVEGFVVLTA